MEKGEKVLDLARMHLEVEDEELTLNLLTACLYALSAIQGLPPGQMLVKVSEFIPNQDEWWEDYLPELVEVFPEDYESIE